MPLRVVVLVVAALAFFVVPAAVDFVADWWWFGEVGYQQVYSTEISTRAIAGAVAFFITVAWLSFNVRLALAAISPAPLTFTTREGFTVALPTRDQVRPLVLVLAAVASFLVASVVSAIGWALPAFSVFDIKSQVVHGRAVAAGLVWGMLAYAAVYSTALVSLATAVFARREFK